MQDREACEHGIAVVPMQIASRFTVGHIKPRRGKQFRLSLGGPIAVPRSEPVVSTLNFLQTNNVGRQTLDGLTQIMDNEARPQ